MVIDFREKNKFHPTFINREPNYKYVGTVLDNKLKWDVWTEHLSKKIQQRMYFLKELLSFNVHNRMLLIYLKKFWCFY